MTSSEILMVIFTGVIAITGVIGSIIFGKQLAAMQGQLEEMKATGKQTDQIISNNKIVADAAKQSAEVAQQTLVATQRAWIDITEIAVAKDIMFDVNGARITLKLTLINRGHSPALAVSPWHSAFVLGATSAHRQQFSRPVVAIIDMSAPAMMFPGVPKEREVSAYVSSEELNQIAGRTGRIFPIICEACVEYLFALSPTTHKTCHTITLVEAETKRILSLPDPIAPIKRETIGFLYQPFGSVAD